MGVNLYIFSQNTKLESFKKMAEELETEKKSVMLTSHKLFRNEREYLEMIFADLEFVSFGDLLTDEENEDIDRESYSSDQTIWQYDREILKRKNEKIYEKIVERYSIENGYVCNADLGIYRLFWISKNFIPLEMDYYHTKRDLRYEKFWVSEYKGKKLIFLGKLDRISYRMNLVWRHSYEDYKEYIEKRYLTKDKCQYLTTLHEYYGNCDVPDNEAYDVRYIQDGYLPPNYSSLYLRIKPQNVTYYAWDIMSMELFNNSDVNASIMPFRKVLKLPYLNRLPRLRNILVATSSPGDWTAQKNRSDEDYTLEAFMEVAKNNPEIRITYRCHPTWVHPEHNGVNSIERIRDYIKYSGYKNICISSNIPEENLEDFCVTFKRSSLEEDLKESDIVFCEHSESMIDAGLKGIPFCSYNFTNRRNLAEGISRFGFMHCTSAIDIQKIIDSYGTYGFIKEYNDAVDKYNKMIELES